MLNPGKTSFTLKIRINLRIKFRQNSKVQTFVVINGDLTDAYLGNDIAAVTKQMTSVKEAYGEKRFYDQK
jgi:hypothetical protein